MNNVIVLGANGQLGSALVLQSKGLFMQPLTRSKFDAEQDDLESNLGSYKDANYLINCIAYHKVDECESNPKKSFSLNAEFPHKLAKFCKDNNICLIHISTDYVFDGESQNGYTETDKPSPLNIYGQSKLKGEELIKDTTSKYFIFRISSLYGRRMNDESNYNFVRKMISSYNDKIQLRVIENQFMSPTYAVDAANAILAVITSGNEDYGLYHLCNSGNCSWYQFAKKIFELLNVTMDIEPVSYTEFHTKAKRPQYSTLDNSKLNKIYEMRNWQEALQEYISPAVG